MFSRHLTIRSKKVNFEFATPQISALTMITEFIRIVIISQSATVVVKSIEIIVVMATIIAAIVIPVAITAIAA